MSIAAAETQAAPIAEKTEVDLDKEAEKQAKQEKKFARITKASKFLDVFALSWVTPILMMAAGDSPKRNLKELWLRLGIPVLSIIVFIIGWWGASLSVKSDIGKIPSPYDVAVQAGVLHQDHLQEQQKEKEFWARHEAKSIAMADAGREYKMPTGYPGKPTFYKQIVISIYTVFIGFFIAVAVGAPLGIMMGMSKYFNAALNPLIQIFKPVSPLAWLPIVMMVISFAIPTDDGLISKSMWISALTVTLCSIWPTLINTALGVASVDKDLMNVGRVLNLKWHKKVTKLVLPSALPLIFTGMRLSLGVGWMVLIAAEMMATNPGLGKFVWDEFQNGSTESLAKIMAAVFVIGIIGFLLDRMMYALQSMFTHTAHR